MRQLGLFGLLALLACDAEVVTRPATQITLRANAGGTAQGAPKLRIIVSAHHGKVWDDAKPSDLSVPKWPVDVPIVPGPGEALDSEFQVIAQALDASGKPLAEARAITNFVPHEQRVLPLDIYPCDVSEGLTICAKLDCDGVECLTCNGRECVPTPDREGSSLDKLDPTEPIEEPIKPADAGAPDAGDVDSPGGLDAGDDAQVPDCPAEPTCNAQGELETCVDGKVRVTVCPHVCLDGACAGVCKPGADVRCAEDAPLQPQICDAQGQWAPDPAQNEGKPCPYLCEKGKCGGECVPEHDVKCENRALWSCSSQAEWTGGAECFHVCRAGACETPPSCTNTDRCSGGDSCCTGDALPGGVFERQILYDSAVDVHATVAPFQMDRFEVTVGRFRKWLDAYADALPAEGDGANPNNTDDHGWDAANWDKELVQGPVGGPDGLKAKLAACPDTTWSDLERDTEDLPINCVTWYEAFAFCVWDGGRLPTEAEWNFAAAAGSEQRIYPWLDPLVNGSPTSDHAVFGGAPIEPVGSKRMGDGKWGHADLLGNVSEWVLDWYNDDYTIAPCSNCAELSSFGLGRVLRGRSWNDVVDVLDNRDRDSRLPQTRNGKVGFRCVRQP